MTDGQGFTVDSAREAAERDELGDWVASFLSSPGSDNGPLGHSLTHPPRSWVGPVQVPLDQLNRLAGPPDHPVLVPLDDDDWRADVEELGEKVQDGWEPPPSVVTFRDGKLHLEDGNHRVEGLRRSGEQVAWCVISFETPEERDAFLDAWAWARP